MACRLRPPNSGVAERSWMTVELSTTPPNFGSCKQADNRETRVRQQPDERLVGKKWMGNTSISRRSVSIANEVGYLLDCGPQSSC
jgi:hypothetical protein